MLILPMYDAPRLFRRARWWQSFLTLAGIVAMITAILAGVFIGLLIAQLGTLALCVTVGLAIFLAFLVAQLRFQHVQWRAARRRLEEWGAPSSSPSSTSPPAS